jgi:multidrug efflux pump subunit AcrA (membrane-fusion protein)
MRSADPVPGTVVWVSADKIVEPRNNYLAYYLVRIKFEKIPELASGKAQSLYPGMPIEAIIVTGSRTALQYMFGPILKSFNRAFREE